MPPGQRRSDRSRIRLSC
uniref:Uncharacterized protein n=1 Tax=Romanomermis culicivorax TaxID=13658 RepID=A0A915JA38_ROMCU